MSALPSYVWALVFVGVVGIPAMTCLALYRGAIAVGLGTRKALAVAAVTGGGWAAWIAGSAVLAAAGVYRQDPTVAQPWIAVAAGGAAVVALVATRIPVVSRVLSAPRTAALLAAPQSIRVVGVVFLLVLASGRLPAAFALPAGLGDIAVGVAAPFVARRLARGEDRRGAVWFNALGIVDLVVAVSLGFLAGLGPNWLAVTPSTAVLGQLPLALIPTVAVPLAVVLHVVSLVRLREPSTRLAAAPQAG